MFPPPASAPLPRSSHQPARWPQSNRSNRSNLVRPTQALALVPLVALALVVLPLLLAPAVGGPALPSAPSAPSSVPPSVPPSLSSTSPPAVRVSTPRSGTAGVWPLSPAPRVLRTFSPPAQRWLSGHRGVDLAGRPGQPVLAAVGGTVSFAGAIGGKRVVVVDHGTTRTTYEPVAALVEKGAAVSAGDRIGVLLQAFSHCYPAACLHWGLREGTTYLDPLTLVGAARIRLLPLGAALLPLRPAGAPDGRRDAVGRW